MGPAPPFEVVISGMSGKFPKCHNVEELRQKLFSQEMLLIPDESRYNPVEKDKPYLTGKIPNVDKYDRVFFGVTKKYQNVADPIMGQVMESSTLAIIDAGMNPYSLRGRNVAVIVASSIGDSEPLNYAKGMTNVDGLSIQATSRSMLANRISYCFNLTGPSYNMDSSWVSGVQALEKAINMVSQGQVEAAVVTSGNLTFHDSVEQEYIDMGAGLLSSSERCSPFDAEADGFLRSEGIVSFFVQRAQDAKRSYCTVVDVKTRCLHGCPANFTAVNPYLETFLRDFYAELQINPNDVSYVETFGFCNKDRDAEELNAVANVFCETSPNNMPLLVGCGVGNYGNAEAASGFVAMAKAIIILEGGVIPPVINYSTPNPKAKGLVSCQLKPVTKATRLPGDLVAVNNLNFSGNAAHILLRQTDKPKKPLSVGKLPEDGLPRLVILQARNEEGANYIAKQVYSAPLDVEFVSLVNDVFKVPIPHYLWRTYTIVPRLDDPSIEIKELEAVKHPVWFVFSGMGSQWTGMGKDLMHIPTFAAAVHKCDQILRPLGVDIKHILTSTDPQLFENILNCFVAITAIQLGLVDCLRALGVQPDGIIGHSMGEVCCGYADGCLTFEETILSSYFRGKASLDTKSTLIDGMMAAVGMGYEAIKDRLPPLVEVACHNASDSSTISGPTDQVMKFVEQLKAEGVFAKAVNVGGIAFHSQHIKTLAPVLLRSLKTVIKSPKPRSSKWISTSVPPAGWGSEAAQTCSAEYLTNNLISPVYFEESCSFIPKKSTVVEIAPRGILQAILRRSISKEFVNIPLSSSIAESNVRHFLSAIGKLHLYCVDVDVNALFPPLQYPVARGTPSLCPLVTWDFEENTLAAFRESINFTVQKNTPEMRISVSKISAEFDFWRKHRINDEVVLPLMQVLMNPWIKIMDAKRLRINTQSVVIEDVIISDHVSVKGAEQVLLTSYAPASFTFEVSVENESCETAKNIITGKVRDVKLQPFEVPKSSANTNSFEKVNMTKIYELLFQAGFSLEFQFQVIKQIVIKDNDCVAKIKWTGDVIIFVDALFKFLTFLKVDEKQSLYLPTSFLRLSINKPLLEEMEIDTMVDVYYDKKSNRLVCAPVELTGVTFKSVTYSSDDVSLLWKEVTFKPYFGCSPSLDDFLRTSAQLAREADLSTWTNRYSRLQLLMVKPKSNENLATYQSLHNIIFNHSQIFENTSEVDINEAIGLLKTPNHQRVLVAGDLETLITLAQSVAENKVYCITFVNEYHVPGSSFRPILHHNHQNRKLVLLKKTCTENPLILTLDGDDWLEVLRRVMVNRSSEQPVVLVSRSLVPGQVLPILAEEPYATSLRTLFIQQTNGPRFSSTSSTFYTQLQLDLPINIFRDGVWGTLTAVDLDINVNSNMNLYVRSFDGKINVNNLGLNPPTFDKDSNIDLQEVRCVDYSGTNKAEQREMGVAEFRSDILCLRQDPVLRWLVPSDWSLLDAATVPVTYGLAYYCLHIIAKVVPGETVLVVAGMSPIGQSVICLALKAGANIITSVESEEEAKFLRNRFPRLNQSILITKNARDMEITVKMLTKGKGVDVLINFQRGQELQSTVVLMDILGRYVHMGHTNVEDRESIGMIVFMKNLSFAAVTVECLMKCTEENKIKIQRAVLEGIKAGDVKPLKRKVFSSCRKTDVLEFLRVNNMEEKTVLCVNEESSTNTRFRFNPQYSVVIAGTSSGLWLEVASWVVDHGGQHLVLLTSEKTFSAKNLSLLKRLTCIPGSSLTLLPLSRADSLQADVEVVEEALQLRPIDTVICVNMDERSPRMKNLDLAFRKVVPGLRRFIALLGEGKGVCEGREKDGLPVCSVRSETSIVNPHNILPYMSVLLSHTTSEARYFVVADSKRMSRKTETAMSLTDMKDLLPQTIVELEALGSILSQTEPREFTSLSLRYEYVKHQLLPFFVVPGISSFRLEPLIQKLMHPVFCPTVPPSLPTVEQCATYLLEQIQTIQEEGPYNLVAETWSGVTTLHLASLLEARGHRVVVFLIDAAPTITKSRAGVFQKPSGVFAAEDFLTCLLGLQGNASVDLSHSSSWNEKVDTALRLQSTLTSKASLNHVRDYLSALKDRLTNILYYHPQKLRLEAQIHLIRTKEASELEEFDISKFSQQRARLHVMENVNLKEMISNPKTAAIINENALYSWNI